MKTAFYPTDILLPDGQDFTKWSVIACDQFTEDRAYWDTLSELIGEAPSTLHMILPEVYLEDADAPERIRRANTTMERYLKEGTLKEYKNAMIYVERTLTTGAIRKGLVGALDLTEYSFSTEEHTLCRPTEQTVAARIPPRKKLREGAALELPHAMMLLDDKQGRVIEAVGAAKDQMQKLYDFDLPMNSGHIAGFLLTDELCRQVQRELVALEEESRRKYGTSLLYLVGDGNHSIATAKSCYADVGQEEHPARYCLTELCNLHDSSLQFEPIHRVVFGADKEDLLSALRAEQPEGEAAVQSFTLLTAKGKETVGLSRPTSKLTVGTLQQFLDAYVETHPEITVDYVHSLASLERCCREGGIGFVLDAMDKDVLFESILSDGVLPRKTFSMGHAEDKRFYLECRKITKSEA